MNDWIEEEDTRWLDKDDWIEDAINWMIREIRRESDIELSGSNNNSISSSVSVNSSTCWLIDEKKKNANYMKDVKITDNPSIAIRDSLSDWESKRSDKKSTAQTDGFERTCWRRLWSWCFSHSSIIGRRYVESVIVVKEWIDDKQDSLREGCSWRRIEKR